MNSSTIGRYDFTKEVQDGLTDNNIELLKEIKDVGVFFSDAFGGAEIEIVGCGRKYYVLYQMSGTILEITTGDEVKCLVFEISRELQKRTKQKYPNIYGTESVCCPLEMAFEN